MARSSWCWGHEGSSTKRRADGSGGRCLNDLVVKGKITTINLVKMLLRFVAGRFALNGDLQQFYNASLYFRIIANVKLAIIMPAR